MSDWKLMELDPGSELSRVHQFLFKKQQDGREIEFQISVNEYLKPPVGAMAFFARADKETNQKLASYTPSGWGNDLLSALSDCVRAINKFPYQGD